MATANITLNPGAGGDIVAADDVGGALHQKIKVTYGADGTATSVDSTNPLPVELPTGDQVVDINSISTIDTLNVDITAVTGTDPLPVTVSGSSDGTQNLPFFRYMDTVGDGSGTKNAILDYSSTQGIYRIAPGAGEIFRVTRLIVCVGDTNGFTPVEYGNMGGAGLANGIQIRIHNGTSTVIDMTDGVPVKTNASWGRQCYDVDLKTWGTSDEILLVRWTFSKSGQDVRLDGDASEELQVLLDDSFTGLTDHYFQVQGYVEDTAT